MVQHLNVPALKQQWVLDVQWTDCPPEVEQVVKHLWRSYELGNDHYMLRLSQQTLLQDGDTFETEVWKDKEDGAYGWTLEDVSVLPLTNYLKDKGIPFDEDVIIHWWW